MKFQISCESIKEYDAESQSYLKCGHILEADSNQVGMLITCPECGGDVEVRSPGLSISSEPLADDAIPDDAIPGDAIQVDAIPVDEDFPQEPLASAGNPPIAREADSATKNPPAVISEPTTPVNLPRPGTSGTRPTDQLKKESFHNVTTPTLQTASFHRSVTCHKCGTILVDKQAVCPNCKTPRRAAYVNKEDRPKVFSKGPFGFQLWLDSITSRTDKNKNTFVFFNIFLMFMTIGTGCAAIVAGGLPGKLIGFVLLAMSASYIYGLRIAGQMRADPRLLLPLPIKISWNVILMLCRSLQFGKIPAAKVLDHRGEKFGDDAIAKISELNQYQLVDLEGTDITDDGLAFFHNLRGIQYLIVRDTAVTEEAVQDLQQTVPKTWIWF